MNLASRCNSRATDFSVTPARSRTRTTWNTGLSRSALPSSTRLARARTLRGLLQRAKPQNWSASNRAGTTNSNAFVRSKELLEGKTVPQRWTRGVLQCLMWHQPTPSFRLWSPGRPSRTAAPPLQLLAMLPNHLWPLPWRFLQRRKLPPLNLLWNLLLLPIIEPAFMTTRRPILTPVKLVAVTTTGNLILLGIKTGKIDCRSQHSSHQEGRSREYHREGSSGYYSSHRDSDRSYWWPQLGWLAHLSTDRTILPFFGVTMLLPLGNDVELHLFRQNWFIAAFTFTCIWQHRSLLPFLASEWLGLSQ